MARFAGVIGFGVSTEVRPGVWKDVMTERPYSGDIVRNSRQLRDGEGLNDDLTLQNSVSIVADAYASEHFFAIRYVKWQGVLWKAESADPQHPRITIRLGGVYNGPRADRSGESS